MKNKILFVAMIFCCLTLNAQQVQYEATIKTSKGDIVIRLYDDTPIHRDNFIKLAKEDFYKNILFHRVIKNFVIQCGDPETQMPMAIKAYGDTDVGYLLDAEIRPNHHHFVGAVCAAREGDEANPERKSSGSQFYIVVGDKVDDKILEQAKEFGAPQFDEETKNKYYKIGGKPHLDGSYTVFGEVVSGMDVATEISVMKTDLNDRPIENVFIKSISIKKAK